MTTLETLKAARELISDPSRWTQGQYARDRKGNCVSDRSINAVCFCASGALWHVGGEIHQAHNALSAVIRESIVQFNDSHTHAEILAKFDEAIAKLEVA